MQNNDRNVYKSILEEKLEEEKEIKELKKMYLNTFSSEEGKEVLLHILNMCGYFANDPSFIKPEKISIANNILIAIGINDIDNYKNDISVRIDNLIELTIREKEL